MKSREEALKEGLQIGEKRGIAETLQKISAALTIPESQLQEMLDSK